MSERQGAKERLATLVTPAGILPNTARKAVLACPERPKQVILLCPSSTPDELSDEVLSIDRRIVCVRLEFDPCHSTAAEVERHVETMKRLVSPKVAGSIYVNCTGGSTAMLLAAEQIARHVERSGRRVQRFGLLSSGVYWVD